MICSLVECGEESSTLSLCEDHRAELADLLDNVDFLIVNLDPNIQAGKVTKKAGGQEGGNGTKSAGSRPPTLDTAQLRAWLWELPRNAYAEARDNPQAGQTLHMARIWVGNARTLVYGNETEDIDHEALRAKLEEDFPEPKPRQEACDYLDRNMGIRIRKFDFENWVKRRKLRYVLDHISNPRFEKRLYFPVDILRTHQKTRQ